MLVSDEATELLARRFLDRPRPGPVSNPAPGGPTVLQQPEKPCVRVRNQVKLLAGTHDDPAELDDAPLSADRMFRLVPPRPSTDRVRLAHLTEAQILDQLIKITVIDPWTEHRALLITRGRIDVVPTGDSSPRHAAQSSSDLGHLAIEDEVTAVAEPWHPYGRVVANLLIGAELDASTQHGRNAAG